MDITGLAQNCAAAGCPMQHARLHNPKTDVDDNSSLYDYPLQRIRHPKFTGSLIDARAWRRRPFVDSY